MSCKIRVLSLFSGIGAFELALSKANIDWTLDHYCEIDKYASQSYNAIHHVDSNCNLGDVRNIDFSKIGNIDLVTFAFPCQDISVAGKCRGFYDKNGNLTRSGLFFNAVDAISKTKPKFTIFENVKNLVGKRFKVEFETVLNTLDEIGYNTYWQVLNAKDYGIPQNRERVFGISIRKDIDKGYVFPKKQVLKLSLKDLLEINVDEKYYLSEAASKRFQFIDTISFKNIFNYNQSKQVIEHIGNVCISKYDSINRVYGTNGLSPTLNTMQGGHLQPKIIELVINNDIIDFSQYDCLSHMDFRIRKLTPRECFRLMGFDDIYFNKIKGVSNTQLYKQAGNSIVVNVLVAIFVELQKQYSKHIKIK